MTEEIEDTAAASENPYNHVVGDSALLIALPELDRHVLPWGLATAPDGITTHVTVLTPFLPEAEITEDVLAELRGVFAGIAAHDLTFAKIGRFPTVLYLVPEPDQPVRDMIAALGARWPQCPPYGGAFEDPAPHLSVVRDADEAGYDQAARILETRLPLRTRAAAVDLLIYDGRRWNLRERFPLAAS
jgi:2'-5' RNA ligase superfamily